MRSMDLDVRLKRVLWDVDSRLPIRLQIRSAWEIEIEVGSAAEAAVEAAVNVAIAPAGKYAENFNVTYQVPHAQFCRQVWFGNLWAAFRHAKRILRETDSAEVRVYRRNGTGIMTLLRNWQYPSREVTP